MTGTRRASVGPFGSFHRTLCLLLTAALVAGPGLAAADTASTGDDACQAWTEQAQGEIQAFFDGQVDAWQIFLADLEQELHDFYASDPTDEEIQAFEADLMARADAKRDALISDQDAFDARMRAGFEEHCGDANLYDGYALRYDYPMPGEEDPHGVETYDDGYDDPYAGDGFDDGYGDGYGDPYHGDGFAYSEECRAHDEARWRALDALQQRHFEEEDALMAEENAAWEALFAEWDERARALEADPNATHEEWDALDEARIQAEQDLERAQSAKWAEMRAGHRDEKLALAAEHPELAECQPPGMPETCTFEAMVRTEVRLEAEIDQKVSEFDELQRHKRHRFEAEMRAEWDAFDDEWRARFDALAADPNATDEDWHALDQENMAAAEALNADQEERWMAFGEKMEQAWRDFDASLDAEFRAFDEEMRRACEGGGHGGDGIESVDGPHAYAPHGECEARLMDRFEAFEAEHEAAYRAFHEGNHTDQEWQAFEDDMRAKARAFEAEMRAEMEACMAELGLDRPDDGHGPDAVEQMGTWRMEWDPASDRGRLIGRHVQLVGDAAVNVLRDIAVQGQVYLTLLDAEDGFAPDCFDMDTPGEGSRLSGCGPSHAAPSFEFELYDNPVGLLKLRADGSCIFGTVHRDVTVVAGGEGRLELVGGQQTATLQGDVGWDAARRVVEVCDGEAVFLVPGADNAAVVDRDDDHRDELGRARRDGSVGAEVSVAVDADGKTVKEVLPLEDMKVDVEAEPAARRVEVTVDADLPEGKTVVISISRDVIGASGQVEVTHLLVDDDGGETEAEIRQASSLLDVLDPTDDETAEYVVVLSADGNAELLVSFPHWSVHKVRVQGMQSPMDLLALPGPGAVAAVLAVAGAAVAVAAGRGRRRG